MLVSGIASFLFLLLSALLLTPREAYSNGIDTLFFTYLNFSLLVIAGGYILSAINSLGTLNAWLCFIMLVFFPLYLRTPGKIKRCVIEISGLKKKILKNIQNNEYIFRDAPFVKAYFFILLSAFAVSFFLNFTGTIGLPGLKKGLAKDVVLRLEGPSKEEAAPVSVEIVSADDGAAGIEPYYLSPCEWRIDDRYIKKIRISIAEKFKNREIDLKIAIGENNYTAAFPEISEKWDLIRKYKKYHGSSDYENIITLQSREDTFGLNKTSLFTTGLINWPGDIEYIKILVMANMWLYMAVFTGVSMAFISLFFIMKVPLKIEISKGGPDAAKEAEGFYEVAGDGGLVLRGRLTIFEKYELWRKMNGGCFVLYMLAITFSFVTGITLINIVSLPQANWDILTYHLSRAAYYIQQSNLSYLDSNYWAQSVHPKISAIFNIYFLLAFMKNDSFTAFIQFSAYIISSVSVYGICRLIGINRISGLSSALVFSLLIQCIMQSSTSQNDMLIASYLAVSVYMILKFRECRMFNRLSAAIISVSIMLGIKTSAVLVLPPLLFLAAFYVRFENIVSALKAVLVSAIFIIIVTCPSGYIENYSIFGSLAGPAEVKTRHTMAGRSFEYIAGTGFKNALRFSFDFLSIDGFTDNEAFKNINRVLRFLPEKMIRAAGIELDDTSEMRPGSYFSYDKSPYANEDLSYFGIMGFAFILPIIVLSLLNYPRNKNAAIFSAAAALFFILQSYLTIYDSWRARQFIAMAVLAVPACGFYFERIGKNKILNRYIFFIVLLGCLSASSSVLFRKYQPLFSVYSMNYEGMRTRSGGSYYQTSRNFEAAVPEGASVAVALPQDNPEYLFFGKNMSRKLFPVNSFFNGLRPVPEHCGYLLFTGNVIKPEKSDVQLGVASFKKIYLRTLKL